MLDRQNHTAAAATCMIAAAAGWGTRVSIVVVRGIGTRIII
jgi:hypothetical protein